MLVESGLKAYLFVSCSLDVANAGDRNQERTFKQWLTKCHTELDKSIRFEKLADDDIQARFQLLAVTLYLRCCTVNTKQPCQYTC